MTNMPTQHILRDIEKKQDEARRNLDNENIVKVRLRPEMFMKQSFVVPLLTNHPVPGGTSTLDISSYIASNPSNFHFTYLFNNLSDEMMVQFRVFMYLSSDIDFVWRTTSEPLDLLGDRSFMTHIWEKVDNINYLLHLHASVLRISKPNHLETRYLQQFYINANLYYFNPATYGVY